MKVSKATAYALHAAMYMVRHSTQLPATTTTIAKAEGIPHAYLAKIFQKLVKAGLVKAQKSKNKGYVFTRHPDQISLLELFEAIEGAPLFSDCFLKHCQCGGTTDNCYIYAKWFGVAKKMTTLLEETSIVAAAWNHPEHRFNSLPESLAEENKKQKTHHPG